MSKHFLLLAATVVSFTCSLHAQTATACLAHHPLYISGVLETNYTQNCTGHDESELFPVSSAPGSARDLTWTAVLPTNGRSSVSDVGQHSGLAAPLPIRKVFSTRLLSNFSSIRIHW